MNDLDKLKSQKILETGEIEKVSKNKKKINFLI